MNALKVMHEGSILILILIMLADNISDRFLGAMQAWEELVAAGYVKNVECKDTTQSVSFLGTLCYACHSPPSMMLCISCYCNKQYSTAFGVKRWGWRSLANLSGP
jgi:hypothetical protein